MALHVLMCNPHQYSGVMMYTHAHARGVIRLQGEVFYTESPHQYSGLMYPHRSKTKTIA